MLSITCSEADIHDIHDFVKRAGTVSPRLSARIRTRPGVGELLPGIADPKEQGSAPAGIQLFQEAMPSPSGEELRYLLSIIARVAGERP
jgi:hypothetical protein